MHYASAHVIHDAAVLWLCCGCGCGSLQSCEDPEAFIAGMDAVIAQVSTTSFRLDKVQIGQVLQDVMTLIRVNKVQVRRALLVAWPRATDCRPNT